MLLGVANSPACLARPMDSVAFLSYGAWEREARHSNLESGLRKSAAVHLGERYKSSPEVTAGGCCGLIGVCM